MTLGWTELLSGGVLHALPRGEPQGFAVSSEVSLFIHTAPLEQSGERKETPRNARISGTNDRVVDRLDRALK